MFEKEKRKKKKEGGEKEKRMRLRRTQHGCIDERSFVEMMVSIASNGQSLASPLHFVQEC